MNKMITVKRVIFFILISLLPLSSYSQKKLQIVLFHSSHCHACINLKTDFLPKLKEKYKQRIEWIELETSQNEDNHALMVSVAARFKKSGSVPSILLGDVFLSGRAQIEQNLEEQIESALKKKPLFISFDRVDLRQLFNKLSLLTVLSLGLVDGVNPCAFAVIVFFVSFLAVYGYKKQEIIFVGSAYCLAVFLTYLFLGLGVFKFLYSLRGMQTLIKAFYYAVAGFCFLLSGCALWDYFRFKKTGETSGMVLQLPSFLKKKINLVIGGGLRQKQERSLIGLAVTSFVIGFLVSLLEAACTGQVYIPTIVFILKNTNLKLKALTYLIIYNLMFILPLVIIFILSIFGVSSQKFNLFLKSNLARIKLIMAAGFFMLGSLILYIS